MANVKHRSRDHRISPVTETLIIGTFNPDSENNPADFFYGRPKNHLWKLLSEAFGEPDLKSASKEAKISFINRHKIDFIDIISEISIPEDTLSDYRDIFIDDKVIRWNDVIAEINCLKNLKKVCFTRKTFSDIPYIKEKIEEVRLLCQNIGIFFKYLITPARIYSNEKQIEWAEFVKKEI